MGDETRSRAAGGLLVVRSMLAEWQGLRAELRAIEEAEHPAFRDRWGRVWRWKSGDVWTHDDTLAYPRDMIDGAYALRGLPPETLRDNPNYHRLCGICRSQWADTSPVSPRCRLGSGWYDVRDGKTYPEQDEYASQLAAWETDGGR